LSLAKKESRPSESSKSKSKDSKRDTSSSKISTSKPKRESSHDVKQDQAQKAKKKKKESSELSGAKIIAVKAGHLKYNKKKKKRYRYGPKKGEPVTSSDESVNELNINTTDWSSSELDECNRLKSERVVKPILARGPPPPLKGWTGEQNRSKHSDIMESRRSKDSGRQASSDSRRPSD